MTTVRARTQAIMERTGKRPPSWWIFCVVLGLCGVSRLPAEEPSIAFLNALRENRFFDEALIYLDRLEANPQTPADLRQELAYQRGVTLIQAVRFDRDRTVREQRLNQAKSSLEAFMRDQPTHVKRSFARQQLGMVLREWALMKLEQVKRADNPAVRQEAAALFDQAYQVFDSASNELREQLAQMKSPDSPGSGTDEGDAAAQLDTLRNEFLDALRRRGEILEEKADTEPADSPGRTKLLEEAGNLFADMFAKYPTRIAGVQARLFQARTLWKRGAREDALKILTADIIPQTDNLPSIRKIKTQGLLLAMDCWLQESSQDYATAIPQVEAWLEDIHPAEENDPIWVGLKFRLAQAQVAWAAQLAAKDDRDPAVTDLRDKARKLARSVSRIPGDYQEPARELLIAIPGGGAAARSGATAESQAPAATFEEAKTRAGDAMTEMQNAQILVETVPERLEKETDAGVREELQKDLVAAQESIERNRNSARTNLERALALADTKTPVDEVNLVRRSLAYLNYQQGEYYDAVVLGEFVARSFPSAPGAATCAQIALAAYLKLYDVGPDEKEFATGRIVSLANYMVQTWAGSPESEDAINALIPLLIGRGEVAKAREYVERMPAESTQRANAELRIGDALWRDYLQGTSEVRQWEREAQEPGAAKEELQAKIASRKPELEGLKSTALSILEPAVERMRTAGSVSATMPRAQLALAQIYIDLDQAPKARALLNDEKIGVLPLAERDDPVIDSPALKEHVYRVALAALVGALPRAENDQDRTELIDKSKELMQKLRQSVGDSPEALQRLVEIYYSLARGLETRIQLQERAQDRMALSDGFGVFLEQVRREASDLRVLNWAAESYMSMGNGLAGDPATANAAKTCFDNAVQTYQQILDNAKTLNVPDDMQRRLTVRRAMARRSAGQYEQAIKDFETVLAGDARKLDVQVEAAMTYQLWGGERGQAPNYKLAIAGSAPDPQTKESLIWGWNRIGKLTASQKAFRDIYHQSRYNAAYCYYKYALRLKQQEERNKYLTFAKSCIVDTQRIFPQMGGAAMLAKYSALLKEIQGALKEKPVGLVAPATKK